MAGLKGLNRATVFGKSDTVKEKFTLVGEDGDYTIVCPGAPVDKDLGALASHVDTRIVSVSQKIGDQGSMVKGRTTSDKAQSGAIYAPFVRHAAAAADIDDEPEPQEEPSEEREPSTV